VTGRVVVVHKGSRTFLRELQRDEYFGEVSFFSEQPRMATVKSKDFT
jgi:CRP-like cAMP-binding protein